MSYSVVVDRQVATNLLPSDLCPEGGQPALTIPSQDLTRIAWAAPHSYREFDTSRPLRFFGEDVDASTGLGRSIPFYRTLSFLDARSLEVIRADLPLGATFFPFAFSCHAGLFAFAAVSEDDATLSVTHTGSGATEHLRGSVNLAALTLDGRPFTWVANGTAYCYLAPVRARPVARATLRSSEWPTSCNTNGDLPVSAGTLERLRGLLLGRIVLANTQSERRLAVLPHEAPYLSIAASTSGDYLLAASLSQPSGFSVARDDLLVRYEIIGLHTGTVLDCGEYRHAPNRVPRWHPTAPDTLIVPHIDGASTRVTFSRPPFTSHATVTTTGPGESLAWTTAGTAVILARHSRRSTVYVLQNGARVPIGTLPMCPHEPGWQDALFAASDVLYPLRIATRSGTDLIEFEGAIYIASTNARGALVLRRLCRERRPAIAAVTTSDHHVVSILPPGKQLLVLDERPTGLSRYVALDMGNGQRTALCSPTRPANSTIRRRRIEYRRPDGVSLCANVDVLADRDASAPPPPAVVWIYPRLAPSAPRLRKARNIYQAVDANSPLLVAAHGYACVTGPTMPIVRGADGYSATFLEQLIANAEALVAALAGANLVDPARIAIGGQCAGAMCAALLMSHSRLFCAGVLRSGYYDRFLSPVSLIGDDTPCWSVPDRYNRLSTVANAPSIGGPVLILHGEDDCGPPHAAASGEALFRALTTVGGDATLLTLPNEGHSIRGKQSLLTMNRTVTDWLAAKVKNAAGIDAGGTRDFRGVEPAPASERR